MNLNIVKIILTLYISYDILTATFAEKNLDAKYHH